MKIAAAVAVAVALILAFALAACTGPPRHPAPFARSECQIDPQPLSCAGWRLSAVSIGPDLRAICELHAKLPASCRWPT